MTRYVMFFDDFPLASENQIFLLNLRRRFRHTDVEIDETKTVPHLEQLLRTHAYAAIILDVMAAFPDAPELEALAGIEVLKRWHSGAYGSLNASASVYMRTARGELYLRDIAAKHGCKGYFRPGSDDDELVSTLIALLFPS
jgi:hypothetical protein